MMVMKMKLSELKKMQKAKLLTINLPKKDSMRLLHLGFYPGVEIQCIQSAPMKDPVIFSVCGNDIILRKKDAQNIEVEVIL